MAANRARMIPVARAATVRNACHGAQFSWNTNHAEMSAKMAGVRTTAHGIA